MSAYTNKSAQLYINRTGKNANTGQNGTIENAQSMLNSITQTNQPLDTIMVLKYDIKTLQSEDSDSKDIFA
jgi:hypothetical protein